MQRIRRILSLGRFALIISRDQGEPEKAVLPAIIFLSSNHPSFEELRRPGFLICIGWWDFSVKFGWFFTNE